MRCFNVIEKYVKSVMNLFLWYDLYTMSYLVLRVILPKRYVKRGVSTGYCGNNISKKLLRRAAPNFSRNFLKHCRWQLPNFTWTRGRNSQGYKFHQNFLGRADDACKFSGRYPERNFLRNDSSGLNSRNSVSKMFLGISDDACYFSDPYLWETYVDGRLLAVSPKNFKEVLSVTLISNCLQHFMSISL